MRTGALTVWIAAVAAVAASGGSIVGDRAMALTRESSWRRVAAVPIAFRTFHPQGMVKIGDEWIVSSVEVIDRDGDRGVGHLFKIAADGSLRVDLKLGDGAIYHLGGIDYDGRDVWVPVAEYRPNSRSILYRVDPATMHPTEVLRFADHIGAIVHDTDDGTLHGVSWGSRRFYRWRLDGRGRVRDASAPHATTNPSHYIDYQDCKYAGGGRMLCSGVMEARPSSDGPPFRLGGLDLVDLRASRPLHQVPVLLWTPAGLDMTHNPVWIEPTASGLRGFFMPEDDRSTIYVYDVDVK